MVSKPGFLTALLAVVVAGCSEPMKPGSGGPTAAAPGTDAARVASVSQIVQEANRAAEAGNLGTAAELFEEALKAEPANRGLVVLLAAVNLRRAAASDYPENAAPSHRAAELWRRIRAESKDLTAIQKSMIPPALFQEARTYAAENKPDQALATLAEAIDAGFSHVDALRTDPALKPLRKSPKFQELVGRVEGAARSDAHKKALSLLESQKSFAFDFKLPSIQEKKVALADFRGNVVIVDIWGTWCGPCRKEIPHLVALAQKDRERGLRIVGINYENETGEKAVELIREAVKSMEIPYPCLIGDDETRSQIADFEGFPTTLFLDRSGKVRVKMVGVEPDQPLVMEELVSVLLEEKPGGGR